MKAIALALATGLAVAGPAWAQNAEPVRKERLEAERHLVPCEQVPDLGDCHTVRRRFLDVYNKAIGGNWQSQLTVGALLTVGGRVQGKPQSYVVPDPIEGCAWRIVGADNQPHRNVADALQALFCNHLTAPDRAAAEARAQSLRQDIADLAVATRQAGAEPVRKERLEAERHLVPCEQVPDLGDCHTARRRFLDAYNKAIRETGRASY